MSRHLIMQAARAAGGVRLADRPRLARALVIGAGRCRDIPVRELLDRFDAITLTDIDGKALKRGIADAEIDPEQASRVRGVVGDVVGVSDTLDGEVAQCLSDTIWTPASCEHLVDRLAATARSLRPEPHRFEERYDLVVASCVISQLHLSVIERINRQFAGRFPEIKWTLPERPIWREAVCELATHMQQAFAQLLETLVAPGGRIYFAATPRVHLVYRGPHGKWKTRETRAMLAHVDLRQFLSEKVVVEAESHWQWSQQLPDDPKKPGDLFDVQALILRSSG